MADYHPCHFGLKKKYLTSLKFRPVAMVVWRILGVFWMKLNVNVSWEKRSHKTYDLFCHNDSLSIPE
jgi:hypothetical protein